MIETPVYPEHIEAKNINIKKWLAFFFICLSFICGSWFMHDGQFFLVMLVTCLAVFFTAIFITILFRVSCSNSRDIYIQEVEFALARWLLQRRKHVKLENIFLFGPLGCSQKAHLTSLFGDEEYSRVAIKNINERGFYIPDVVAGAVGDRQLAIINILIDCLLDEIDPEVCFLDLYWFGDEFTKNMFSEQLTKLGKIGVLGSSSCFTLSDFESVIDHLSQRSDEQESTKSLVAGLLVPDAMLNTHGESAFLWVIGDKGGAVLHKPERQDTDLESPIDIAEAVLRNTDLLEAPVDVVSMSEKSSRNFQITQWPTLDHVVEPYWGDLGDISIFIAISLAALHAQQKSSATAWLAQDASGHDFLGVVKHNE